MAFKGIPSKDYIYPVAMLIVKYNGYDSGGGHKPNAAEVTSSM